ncbi:purple acid phosphatase family protein [Kitasatospora sp. NPDC088391]|uniref:purple acid phosphatase family protein n=1 Tax=Kitasatospora sp. NPDC088391 TaxID=3364074 RepID=UPI003818C5FB
MDLPGFRVSRRRADEMTIAEQYEYWQDVRKGVSRRSVLRAGIFGAAAVAAGPMLMTRAAYADTPGSAVVPFGRHLAFGNDPATQMRVGWQVPSAVSNPVLRLGTSPTDLSQTVQAEIRNLHSDYGTGAPLEQYYGHAALDKLSPNTTYYYAVGHEGLEAASGPVNSFTTGPTGSGSALQPFTFTAMGDQGASAQAALENAQITAQNPKFHLLAGDICYADPNGQGKLTDSYNPAVWDSYLKQIEPVAQSVPWMVATGNHDMEAWYSPNGYGGHQKRLDLPTSGPTECPSVYAFTYGNVAVLSLDANDVSYEIKANLNYSNGAQTSWLEQTLAKLRADPTIDFVIVFFHHCAYAVTTSHVSDGGVREKWAPLFDKYNVDLVINGHNHMYERTDPIRGGNPTRAAAVGDTVNPVADGTTYIVAGGGGASLYSLPSNGPESYAGNVKDVSGVTAGYFGAGGKVSEAVNWSRVRYRGHNLLAVDVKPAAPGGTATLTVRGISVEGAKAGTEIDRITISRTAATVDTPAFGSGALLAGAALAAGAGYAGYSAWQKHRSGLEVPAS